jgi:hypothetical protein
MQRALSERHRGTEDSYGLDGARESIVGAEPDRVPSAETYLVLYALTWRAYPYIAG